MFAEFNYDKFPLVYVKLNNIDSEEDFDKFLNDWLNLYIQKKDFTFIFDTTNVNKAPLKYSIKMSQFIKNLKRQPRQYLQKSIILVNSNFVLKLLKFIFWCQSPIAPVYIINDLNQINLALEGNIENCIMPGKSILPFL